MNGWPAYARPPLWGQSQRGAIGAYQAWRITVLVLALGAVFTAMGAAFLALTVRGA